MNHTKQTGATNLSLPADIFIYKLARLSASCFAIASNDSLISFDFSTLQVQSSYNDPGVTSLCRSSDGTFPMTAGRAGLVKLWDPRVQQPSTIFQNSNTSPLSALAASDNLIAAGTESSKEGLGDVSVLVWDTRQPKSPMREYKESHTDTITQLAFDPRSTKTLLSASTDGLVSLFNTSISDEDDALMQVINHSAAVHCAGFLEPEDQVYAISTDEQLSVYTLGVPDEGDESELPVVRFGDIRETIKSSYVVDIIRSGQSSWVASGNTESSTMYLTPLKPSWDLDYENRITFEHAHGQEVVRDMLLDEQHQRVLTCGEDGHVRSWTVPALDTAHEIPDRTQSKKKGSKDKSGKKRFQPY